MKQSELEESIGKKARINGGRDLGMIAEMRSVIGELCTVVKRCKSGLVLVEHEGKHYSLALYNLDKIGTYIEGGKYSDEVGLKLVWTAQEKSPGILETTYKEHELMMRPVGGGSEYDGISDGCIVYGSDDLEDIERHLMWFVNGVPFPKRPTLLVREVSVNVVPKG